jgi:hypothetical protein
LKMYHVLEAAQARGQTHQNHRELAAQRLKGLLV